jgi:hypothetical protein
MPESPERTDLPKLTFVMGKQPQEILPVGRKVQTFEQDAVSGETITAATITVTPTGDVDDLVATSPELDGIRVSIGLSGGRHGIDYHVEMLAATSAGAVYDADWLIKVREV